MPGMPPACAGHQVWGSLSEAAQQCRIGIGKCSSCIATWHCHATSWYLVIKFKHELSQTITVNSNTSQDRYHTVNLSVRRCDKVLSEVAPLFVFVWLMSKQK
jgi:hypothetical protein